MKSIRIAAAASDEFVEAVLWYEQRRPLLGAEFFDAVAAVIDLIRAHPEIGTASTFGTAIRQVRVRKFPYKVVYRNQQDGIEIIAVAHGKRRPGYWKGRR